MTPLHLAAIGGHDDVCAQLLAQGADPSAKDKLGRTALVYATKLGRDAVRRRLLATAATKGAASAGSSKDGTRATLRLRE